MDPDLLGYGGGEGEAGDIDAAFMDELEKMEMDLGIIPSTDNVEGDSEMVQDGEEEEDEEDDEEDDEEEEEEDDDEEEGEEDEEEDEEEDDDDKEDDEEDGEGTQREEWVDCPEEMIFRYPASVPDFTTLDAREQAFKCARFLPCQAEGCICEGLEPPMSSTPELQIISRADLEAGELEELDAPDGAEDGAVEKWRSEEGWWRFCGRCGHGWEGSGHVFASTEARGERIRKGRVIGRIEEFLEVSTRSRC
jgi:histone acetyltransferase